MSASRIEKSDSSECDSSRSRTDAASCSPWDACASALSSHVEESACTASSLPAPRGTTARYVRSAPCTTPCTAVVHRGGAPRWCTAVVHRANTAPAPRRAVHYMRFDDWHCARTALVDVYLVKVEEAAHAEERHERVVLLGHVDLAHVSREATQRVREDVPAGVRGARLRGMRCLRGWPRRTARPGEGS